ncbi:aspartate carbamoyltransferase catalytic subunit [Pseudomarimonas salicorniae]|uniref:Aspartate carbamoyltransferase n=1 Tax=Pseudomarimonas salicorniae TaxID=2933270 RepID=A0ABT0GIJ5_9GAMM|nr:aspartate carbamoyltransferase catalytic subunit [Lysobacter sp. CAU 1642]MCK7594366.1 aspartate carbamoyltransferase catalytic subunit [Lysobacter sp. CAU 1642]
MTHATLRHLLSLADLSASELDRLLQRAQSLRERALGAPLPEAPLAGKTVVNLFFEPSTRTRSSFELAAKRLGATVLNFDMANSSTRKGETLADTLYTLEAMGADVFVVRHGTDGVVAQLASICAPRSRLVNAGDGRSHHPTQGLLDMLTIRQHKGQDFSTLSVALIGDIRHSRVARSDLRALRLLNTGEIRIAAPESLLPESSVQEGCRLCTSADEAVEGADVVMTLRLQRERMEEGLVTSLEAYFRDWGITPERLALAKPDAIVMHPGPMNRGVEIADAVADGPQSVIREQVSNGVAVRMAVLEALA